MSHGMILVLARHDGFTCRFFLAGVKLETWEGSIENQLRVGLWLHKNRGYSPGYPFMPLIRSQLRLQLVVAHLATIAGVCSYCSLDHCRNPKQNLKKNESPTIQPNQTKNQHHHDHKLCRPGRTAVHLYIGKSLRPQVSIAVTRGWCCWWRKSCNSWGW